MMLIFTTALGMWLICFKLGRVYTATTPKHARPFRSAQSGSIQAIPFHPPVLLRSPIWTAVVLCGCG